MSESMMKWKMAGLEFRHEIHSSIWLNSILTLRLTSMRDENSDSTP